MFIVGLNIPSKVDPRFSWKYHHGNTTILKLPRQIPDSMAGNQFIYRYAGNTGSYSNGRQMQLKVMPMIQSHQWSSEITALKSYGLQWWCAPLTMFSFRTNWLNYVLPGFHRTSDYMQHSGLPQDAVTVAPTIWAFSNTFHKCLQNSSMPHGHHRGSQ